MLSQPCSDFVLNLHDGMDSPRFDLRSYITVLYLYHSYFVQLYLTPTVQNVQTTDTHFIATHLIKEN